MELSFRLKKTPEIIFDYLTDMQKFASVHPVIFQIDKTANNTYLVHEKLKFGFTSFSFTYPVTIEKHDHDKIVVFRAIVMKLVRIEMRFVLKPDNDYTIVLERIEFKSQLPLKSAMQSIFRKQHGELFRNIELVAK